MLSLSWLVPGLPLLGFVVLGLFGRRLPRPAVAAVGVGSVGAAAGVTAWIAVHFVVAPPPGHAFVQTLWTWFQVDGLRPTVAFRLDPLSLTMMAVVTGVGFLIHLYSSEYMEREEDFSRYFAWLNLFVAAMVTLVLADDLLLLFVGWEAVGLCSYLLIGFWYRDPANGRAARKAFVVTRVGDTAFVVGLLLLFTRLGTLAIPDVLARAPVAWPTGSGVAVAAAALLLVGALGKSAQLPLQTWLPDAMAGPTPVSALIHAATMVTAGVYLVARMHPLFALAPPVQEAVAVIGATTLVVAGASALTQRDIKRILAYSTISQIGYMFLALGVGAWSAAVFHLVSHAFFKSLLFLCAGAMIHAMDGEHDIFAMGGLRRELPFVTVAFLVAAGSLAGFPLVTAGFYSKDEILFDAWAASGGSPALWIAGVVGALLTALYIFRAAFVAFFGEAARGRVARRPRWRIHATLAVLAVLSLAGGALGVPRTLGNLPVLADFLAPTLPAPDLVRGGLSMQIALQVTAALVSLGGIGLAWLAFRPRAARSARVPLLPAPLERLWCAGWGFDRAYDAALVRPVLHLARAGRSDVVDLLYRGLAASLRGASRALRVTESGRVRWYAGGLAAGTIFFLALVIWS